MKISISDSDNNTPIQEEYGELILAFIGKKLLNDKLDISTSLLKDPSMDDEKTKKFILSNFINLARYVNESYWKDQSESETHTNVMILIEKLEKDVFSPVTLN